MTLCSSRKQIAKQRNRHCVKLLTGPSAPLSIQLFDRIEDVNCSEWDSCAPESNLFLNRDYLRAMEFSQIPMCHAIFKDNSGPAGIASYHVADFTGAPIDSYLEHSCTIVDQITRRIKLMRQPLNSKVVVCGSLLTSGEHGYAFLDGVSPEIAARSLASAAKNAKRHLDKVVPTSGILIKEFFPRSDSFVHYLSKRRYSEFHTDPAMILSVDEEWNSFNDYLQSLSSKYRVKAKRAYEKSRLLLERDLDLTDLLAHRDQLAHLYTSVVKKAPFKLGELEIGLLFDLRQHFGSEFILKGYFLRENLVGFLMGFINGDTLDAGLVGIEYTENQSHSIYPRMLYDYLQIAIKRGLKRVNYGRTAGEIKSTLGAVPVDLTCCLSLDRPVLNTMLPILSSAVKPQPFPLRKPFKKKWYATKDSCPLGNAPVPALTQMADGAHL